MYAAGGFNFPTVTGNFSVTGLGFQPVGVILFGGNQATVGSLVTGLSGPGLFVSINGHDYSSPGSILSFGLGANGASDNDHANYRGIESPSGLISMQTDAINSNTRDYKASSISFDADGFTINVSNAATGVRPIHWWAFGGTVSTDNLTEIVSGMVKQTMNNVSNPSFPNDFQPLSTFVLSTVASNGFGEDNVNGDCYYSWGSGHWPEFDVSNSETWQSCHAHSQIQIASSLGRQGFTGQPVFEGDNVPDVLANSSTISALGPVLVERNRTHRPDISDPTTLLNRDTIGGGGTGGSSPIYQGCLWWNGEGWCDSVTVPAGGQVTVTAPPHIGEFQLIMFSSVNSSQSSGGSTDLAFMFGVLHADYQGCLVFSKEGAFYQSTDECAAECDSSDFSSAVGSIQGRTFTLTSEHGSSFSVLWHGFGAATSGWLPQLYRWQRPPTFG